MRFCATLCMLGAVAITAAVASLAASLYGQGKLSAEDAWQLVPPALVPASVAVVLPLPSPAPAPPAPDILRPGRAPAGRAPGRGPAGLPH